MRKIALSVIAISSFAQAQEFVDISPEFNAAFNRCVVGVSASQTPHVWAQTGNVTQERRVANGTAWIDSQISASGFIDRVRMINSRRGTRMYGYEADYNTHYRYNANTNGWRDTRVCGEASIGGFGVDLGCTPWATVDRTWSDHKVGGSVRARFIADNDTGMKMQLFWELDRGSFHNDRPNNFIATYVVPKMRDQFRDCAIRALNDIKEDDMPALRDMELIQVLPDRFGN